jgi:hypothetical protein
MVRRATWSAGIPAGRSAGFQPASVEGKGLAESSAGKMPADRPPGRRRSSLLHRSAERADVLLEHIVEQRSRPSLSKALDDGIAIHSKFVKDQTRHER